MVVIMVGSPMSMLVGSGNRVIMRRLVIALNVPMFGGAGRYRFRDGGFSRR